MKKSFFKLDVFYIKYDGANKDFICNELKIKKHISKYFKSCPSYFIIPKHNKEDWFIINEKDFNKKIYQI